MTEPSSLNCDDAPLAPAADMPEENSATASGPAPGPDGADEASDPAQGERPGEMSGASGDALTDPLQLARDRLAEGRFEAAESLLRELAAAGSEKTAEAFSLLGVCLRELRRHREAVDAGLRSIRYAEPTPELLYQLALTYHARSMFAEALDHARRVLDLNSGHLGAQALVAELGRSGDNTARDQAHEPRLFVIGHGRSGTTVLLTALNTSSDVFMMGEAQLYQTGGQPYFRSRYYLQHRDWGNQRTKSTYAPPIAGLPEHATGDEYLSALGSRVRWVGEKIVLGPESAGHDLQKLRLAIERNFWDSRLVWAIRRPRSVIASCMRRWGESPGIWIRSVARSLLLMIDQCRVLPNVFVTCHETTDPSTFEALSRHLGIGLSAAARVYTDERKDVDDDWEAEGPWAPALEQLDESYGRLVKLIDPQQCRFPAWELQIEQQLPGVEGPQPRVIGDCVRGLMAIATLDPQPPS
jgi:tetratricopeptide (TPR) repeat protein